MASPSNFAVHPVELQNEIKRRDELVESSRRVRFIAARRIQAWFRGVITRNHLRMLHERATTIQRYWRGCRGRIIADRYLIQRVSQMWRDYYDRMAIKIQAAWRGYWTRRTIVNLRERRQWLIAVYAKNEETLENMRKFRQQEGERVKELLEQESMLWILFILFKLHHLLRTKHRPGVITRIDKTRFTVIEQMLRCLEYVLYTPKKKTVCENCQIDPRPSLIFRGTYFERCEKEIREFERSLQAGDVSIARSQPYEEERQMISRVDRLGFELLRQINQTERFSKTRNGIGKRNREKISQITNGGRHCACHQSAGNSSCPSLDSGIFHVKPNELYDAIRKMDCRLDRLRIKCPVHNFAFPS